MTSIAGAQGREAISNPSQTLQEFLWCLDIVHVRSAQTELDLGNNALDVIQVPKTIGWDLMGPGTSETREAMVVVPSWWVFDRSGMRGGATFSAMCYRGELILNMVRADDLMPSKGEIKVDWSFDGEPFSTGTWQQNEWFVLPQDNFPHTEFVNRLSTAQYLVLRILEVNRNKGGSAVGRRENGILVPLDLTKDRTALFQIIKKCPPDEDAD